VKDPSGSVVPNAECDRPGSTRASFTERRPTAKGYFTLPVLPVGRYELEVQAPGFRAYRRKGIVLDTNAALTLDVPLRSRQRERDGEREATMRCMSRRSSTQLGQVITGRQMTPFLSNGRSFTDLLSLQPGVAPATSITSSTVQDVGATS
jgi:hypothetical protein